MVCIYLLELTDKKYYVGRTHNLIFRMEDIDYNISKWVQKYKPISVLKVIQDCDVNDEDKYTRKYMDLYGVHNVRGGSFSNEHLDPAVLALIAKPVDYRPCEPYDTYDTETKLILLEAKVASLDKPISSQYLNNIALSLQHMNTLLNTVMVKINTNEPDNFNPPLKNADSDDYMQMYV